MASASASRALRLALRRSCNYPLKQWQPSRCSFNPAVRSLVTLPMADNNERRRGRSFHHTPLSSVGDDGGKGEDHDEVREKGLVSKDELAEGPGRGPPDIVENEDDFGVPGAEEGIDIDNGETGSSEEDDDYKPMKLSMNDDDEPDFFDLADLIMSGSSYEDAVRGTAFDDLDPETAAAVMESQKKLDHLKKGTLEEYLVEQGDTEQVRDVNAPERRRMKKANRAEVNQLPSEPDTVEMAQGDWSETLVHNDRVQKTVKGGMEVSYRALVVVGNLNGVGGFAMGKADNPIDAVTAASRKAKLPHNLVYVERYKSACLYVDVLGKHNGCKVYIWARQPGYGMRASPLMRQLLYGMGITDCGCKIVGNRNRYSIVYALFKALGKHRGLEATAKARGKRILALHKGHEVFAH